MRYFLSSFGAALRSRRALVPPSEVGVWHMCRKRQAINLWLHVVIVCEDSGSPLYGMLAFSLCWCGPDAPCCFGFGLDGRVFWAFLAVVGK